MRAVLALDQGSHASRACLVDEQGGVRDQCTVEVTTRHEPDGRVEQDPGELLTSLQQAIATLGAAHPRVEWLAAGLATQRSTLLCCQSSTLQPLTAALSWQDRRHAGWLAGFAPQAARVRALTGLPLSAHYGVAKLRWCVEHDAAVRTAIGADTLLATPLSAWLQARLTGNAPHVDPANAARTLLYDSARLDWSDELLQLFGVQRGWLPQCTGTRAHFGTLMATTIPLTAVSGDQSVVPFGFGTPRPQDLCINLGTGAFLQRLCARPEDPAPLLGSVLYADARQRLYSLEGTVNGAGNALAAFCAAEQLEQAALWPAFEQLPADTPLPLYLNGTGGLGSPWWQPLQSAFIGRGGTLWRFAAVVESIVFLLAVNARLVAQHGPLERVLLAGGLSRSDALCQRLANLLRLPVLRGERETSARGIAALAAPQLAALWPEPPWQRFEPQPDSALDARCAAFESALDDRLGGAR